MPKIKQRRVDIAGNKELIQDSKQWLEKKFGFTFYVYPHENIFILRLNTKDHIYQFLSWLYKDATIYMNRKYDKYLEFCKEFNYIPVKTSKLLS